MANYGQRAPTRTRSGIGTREMIMFNPYLLRHSENVYNPDVGHQRQTTMAPAPELASKEFNKVVDQLWKEKKDDYIDSPEQFFNDINEMFEDRKLFISLHTSEVLPGYLVSARCMVQNTLAPEYFPLSCTVSDGTEKIETTGCLRDHFGENITDVVDHGNHGCRNCYKMIMVPGAADWWIDEFNQTHTTALCKNDEDQMDVESPGPAPTKVSEFIAKVFDNGAPELKPNTVVDVYGYLSAPIHSNSDSEGSTAAPNHFSVHVLRFKEVTHIPSTVTEPRTLPELCSLRSEIVKEISSVLGSSAAADIFVNFLVSTTYSRPGGTPLCFLPLNIVGVADEESAGSIISMVKHLIPKVKVLTLTPDLLCKKRFAPVKNYEADDLLQGELQLSNGTALIIDETQLPVGSFPVNGFVEENLKVLEDLIVDHRMHYDYGFYKIPMDVDYNVLILSKKESRFFKTPFRIPLGSSGEIPPSFGNIEHKRQFIQQSRVSVSKVSLKDEVSKKIQDSFVSMCSSLDAKTDKAALLNEMLIMSRLVASSNGSESVEFKHWEHAIQISSANSVLSIVWSTHQYTLMVRFGTLLAATFLYVNANCPPGYTDGNNDICYKVYSNHSNYFDASSQCDSDGGRLASIHNAFVDLIQQMAEKAASLVWLGLRCPDATVSNCKWDDGQGAPYPYNAFLQGNPSITGECVLMMISGKADGQWISGDCDNMQIGFACQMGKQASCGDYNEYGGKCYKAYDERLSYDAAESLCNGECGHLVSIHSLNENMMVYDLLPNNENYARIGLKHSDVSFAWSDNTTYDYDNFGNSNPAFGDCVAMSLIPELVEKERWITISCTVELPFVCERAQGACLGPATTSVPTLAPPTCNGAYFMEENGTFYSPGYPASYHDYKTCIYVMTVTPGDLVQIHFVDVQLSAPSIIELYNNFADVDPFEIISSDIPSTKYFASTTNVMKMAFVAGNNGSAINRWEAVFSSKSKTVTTISTVTVTPSPLNPSGCNENSVVPSNITSPRYPANYPPLTQCRYQLTSDSSHRIQLTFGAIDTEQCCDIIDVYDFDGSPYYPLLDRFSGQIAAGAKVFKSSMNQLFVDFYSDSINQRSGFTAVAVPIL
ncbi:hypothetical protein RB195_013645 [Necator americanus]|uniref:Lectin C-type domain protein n=2 Tax=Necator americanus TaxID=51031 RepID=A0ABR1DWN6_NECAM